MLLFHSAMGIIESNSSLNLNFGKLNHLWTLFKIILFCLNSRFFPHSLAPRTVTLTVAPRRLSAEQSHFVFVDVNSYLSLVAADSSLADPTVVRLEPALQAHRLLSTRFAGNKLVARLAAVGRRCCRGS